MLEHPLEPGIGDVGRNTELIVDIKFLLDDPPKRFRELFIFSDAAAWNKPCFFGRLIIPETE